MGCLFSRGRKKSSEKPKVPISYSEKRTGLDKRSRKKEINDKKSLLPEVVNKDKIHQIRISKYDWKCNGLSNNNNNCYFNSVMQVLAHFQGISEKINISPIGKLLNLMVTKEGGKNAYLHQTLLSTLEWLDRNSEFKLNFQHDPKELLNYILRELPIIASQFKWKRVVQFVHNSKGHVNTMPEQSFLYFQISPKNNKISLNDLKVSFMTLVLCEEDVVGYCNECNSDCTGSERILSSFDGNYAIFNTYSMQADCRLDEIEYFNFGKYQFQLESIIIRQGKNSMSGHNFTICRESKLVIYNDEHIEVCSEYNIHGVYMLFYKVIYH